MSAENYTVWAWKDARGEVRYVGWGRYDRKYGHPSNVKWFERYRDNSPLHAWLQSLEDQPEREVCGSTIMTRDIAYALACSYRKRYESTILKSRGSMSYKGGGSAKQVVFAPDDDFTKAVIYTSVREAARRTGLAGSTITRRCQNKKNYEWIMVE